MASLCKPRFLMTNDDGIDSPGLLAAVAAVAGVTSGAEMTVVAPATQQTGMGRSHQGQPSAILQPRQLHVEGAVCDAYALEASPAKSVNHGLHALSLRPDLLISGINYGENMGSTITGSGTVGAAFEGASNGIPSLAVSLETPINSHFNYTEQNWDVAMYFLGYFVQRVLEHGFPRYVDVLKIDVPASATRDTPWRLTRLSPNPYYSVRLPSASLHSAVGDAVFSKGAAVDEPHDTDVYTLAVDRVVSVTPLTLDQTAYRSFASLNVWQTGR